jgi:hypothetical protein
MKLKSFLTILLTFLSFQTLANSIDEGVLIVNYNIKTLELLKNQKEFTLDHLKRESLELYGPVGLKKFLTQNKIQFREFEKVSPSIASDYPSFAENEKELKSLAKTYPQIVKLYSIGKSAKGLNLWVVKLSKNAKLDDSRPEFKYVANMHGDEIVGREMMIHLIKYLAENYGVDNRVTNLLDKVQIHIMPSMNPDGAEKRQRANGNGIDLNRDFPDFSTKDNQNTTLKRQPETVAVMNWQKAHNFILSANFHGGAEVVNYPWDTTADKYPQEELIKDLSLNYAHEASYIGTSTSFENGITNGFAWYEVDGGMQDWSIYFHDDTQITIELSDTKWPKYSMIDYYFEQNKNAMISFIESIDRIKLSYQK